MPQELAPALRRARNQMRNFSSMIGSCPCLSRVVMHGSGTDRAMAHRSARSEPGILRTMAGPRSSCPAGLFAGATLGSTTDRTGQTRR